MIKISAVIPLYNCGKYIIRCLESLARQGLHESEYEVIVINDGSSDEGPLMTERYILSHPNVKILNQENAGVSAARNKGLEVAEGDFIHFIDADDYLVDGGWNFLIGGGYLDDCQIVKLSSKTINEENVNIYCNYDDAKLNFFGSGKEYVLSYGFNSSVATSLYKREFLLKNHIKLEKLTHKEDLLFNIRCYLIPDLTVKFTDAIIYGYYNRPGSTSRTYTKTSTYKFIEDNIILRKKLVEVKRQCAVTDLLPLINKHIAGCGISCCRLLVTTPSLSYSEIRKIIRRCRDEQVLPLKSLMKKDIFRNILIEFPFLIKIYHCFR